MADYFVLSRADIAYLLSHGRKIDNVTGDGVISRPDGISINPLRRGRRTADRRPKRSLVFPVDLVSDGGAAGSSSTTVSFTYTPTFIDGSDVANADGALVTTLTPRVGRMANVEHVAADFGYLHRDGSGNWALGWCNERPADPAECTS